MNRQRMYEAFNSSLKLTRAEHSVRLGLAWHEHHQTRLCNPTENCLARENHLSHRSVERAIQGLQRKGLLKVTVEWTRDVIGKLRRKNSYELLPEAAALASQSNKSIRHGDGTTKPIDPPKRRKSTRHTGSGNMKRKCEEENLKASPSVSKDDPSEEQAGQVDTEVVQMDIGVSPESGGEVDPEFPVMVDTEPHPFQQIALGRIFNPDFDPDIHIEDREDAVGRRRYLVPPILMMAPGEGAVLNVPARTDDARPFPGIEYFPFDVLVASYYEDRLNISGIFNRNRLSQVHEQFQAAYRDKTSTDWWMVFLKFVKRFADGRTGSFVYADGDWGFPMRKLSLDGVCAREGRFIEMFDEYEIEDPFEGCSIMVPAPTDQSTPVPEDYFCVENDDLAAITGGFMPRYLKIPEIEDVDFDRAVTRFVDYQQEKNRQSKDWWTDWTKWIEGDGLNLRKRRTTNEKKQQGGNRSNQTATRGFIRGRVDMARRTGADVG